MISCFTVSSDSSLWVFVIFFLKVSNIDVLSECAPPKGSLIISSIEQELYSETMRDVTNDRYKAELNKAGLNR